MTTSAGDGRLEIAPVQCHVRGAHVPADGSSPDPRPGRASRDVRGPSRVGDPGAPGRTGWRRLVGGLARSVGRTRMDERIVVGEAAIPKGVDSIELHRCNFGRPRPPNGQDGPQSDRIGLAENPESGFSSPL